MHICTVPLDLNLSLAQVLHTLTLFIEHLVHAHVQVLHAHVQVLNAREQMLHAREQMLHALVHHSTSIKYTRE